MNQQLVKNDKVVISNQQTNNQVIKIQQYIHTYKSRFQTTNSDQLTEFLQSINQRFSEMKWKPDSIQQFIRYKIQHPQESLTSFKNYQAQQKHNQVIQQLYKQLTKHRSQLNHFKTQLFKMNQVAGRQLEANREEVVMVEERISTVGEKIIKAKTMVGVSSKERRRMLVEEWQGEIQKVVKEMGDDKIDAERKAEEIREKIEEQMGYDKRDGMINKIKLLQKRIQEKVKEQQIKKEKLLRLKELTQKNSLMKDNVSVLKTQLTQIKHTKQQQQKQQQQLKNKQATDTLKRLHKFKQQFLSIIQNQSKQSTITPHLQQLLIFDTSERKWNMWKEQFNQNVLAVQEYLRRVEYYVGANFSVVKEEGSEKQLSDDEIEESKRYLEEFGVGEEVAGLEQQQQYERCLKALTDKIQLIRANSKEYYEKQEKQLKSKQSQYDTKEKQLDKEITQLQAKVNKTYLQISKFLKNKH